MKNLFFAIAFLFVGNVGFANSPADKFLDEDNHLLFKSFDNNDVKNVNLTFSVPYFCYYSETITTTIGGATYTETFTYIGWSSSPIGCAIDVMVAQLTMADFTGN